MANDKKPTIVFVVFGATRPTGHVTVNIDAKGYSQQAVEVPLKVHWHGN